MFSFHMIYPGRKLKPQPFKRTECHGRIVYLDPHPVLQCDLPNGIIRFVAGVGIIEILGILVLIDVYYGFFG